MSSSAAANLDARSSSSAQRSLRSPRTTARPSGNASATDSHKVAQLSSTVGTPTRSAKGRKDYTNGRCRVGPGDRIQQKGWGMADDAPVQPSLFDADNHYYEARDAFTRHVPPRMAERTVMEVTVNGRVRHLIGGRLNHAVTNPTFDPVSKPGALYAYFRGNPDGREIRELLSDSEPIRPEYRDPAARIAVMDAQQIEAAWLFPTLGVMYEEALKHDPEAVGIAFRAFNRWLDEDWGLNYRGRVLAAPYISLADVNWAVTELEWALDHEARVVCVRPVAPTCADGPC